MVPEGRGTFVESNSGEINIEALCTAPPEALAHSPSQMPLIEGDTGFSKVRKQGPSRPVVVPWDHKRRGVGLIGANSGVVTAQAGSSV